MLGRPRVLRNIFSNWGSYVIAMGVNFFLSPYVVRKLGTTGYGVWTLILALTGYLGLLDLGVRGAVTRYVAKFHTQIKHDRSSHVASSAMVIFSTAGLLAILASAIMAGFVIEHLDIPRQSTVFALHLGYGIIALACLQLGFTVARWVANIILVRYLYPELRIHLALADRAGVKLIFSFSVFSFLLHVSSSLIYATDNVVIGAYLPVAAVTFYAIGGNLAEYTRTLVSGISQTMTPLASSTEATRDQQQVQKVVLFGARAGSMVVLPIAVTFMLRGSRFIGLWMGPEYAETSGKVICILSLTLLFWAGNSVTAGSLLGLSKHKPLVPVLLSEGLCNLTLSILWIRSMGIVGVAWGTVVPAVASAILFWPWYVRRTLGIQPLTYATSVWLRPMLAILPFALGTYAVDHYWLTERLIVFFMQVALVLPLALGGYWLICLDKTQRKDYARGLSQSFERAVARS